MGAIETMSAAGAGRTGAWSGFVRKIETFALRLTERVEFVLDRRRSRLALLELTDEQLKDIGLSRADAHGEGNRPFWD